jgi:hypothetical protein
VYDDAQVGDLGTEFVERCVNLWVELEVAVGFQRLMSCLLHLLPILGWQRKRMSKMTVVKQRMLNE